MIGIDKVDRILYGGDYNPEQWPEEIWEEDMRLLKQANINILTLNVFSWATLQPSEDEYDFFKLDKIMEFIRKNGFQVCMATSTAAHPAWMAKRYPDVLRVEYNGMKRNFGARHNSCQNSETYRKYASALVDKLAERYKGYENIVAWHVSNEYCGECYCDNCAKAFREWLRNRYGTIEKVNEVWNTSFWSHTFYDFDEIVPADLRSEEFYWDGVPRTNFQGISLDYRRFISDTMLECFLMEKNIIKKHTPDIPVTTNFMGWYKGLDYNKWAKEMDFVAWDNYPSYDAKAYQPASFHDLVRGMKGGMPFSLIEQTPGVSNWHIYAKLKRPGETRLWSYQALAHGSDTVMFFQMRRSRGACEKYHSAVIDHVGTDETRVYKEISRMGAELAKLGSQTLGTRISAKVAILFDWENWWAAELSAGPSKLINYAEEITTYYNAFYKRNIAVDLIPVDADISSYSLVLAPMLYMNKAGFDDKIREYVRAGGNYLTSYFSGYVDENDLVILGGYPGAQKDILGIWVEESDALPPEENNSFIYNGKEYSAGILCDIMHLRGAKEIAHYEKEFYAGTPVITRNTFGSGQAFYVGTRSDEEFYDDFLKEICDELEIKPVMETPEGVEVTCRENTDNKYYFILNHNDEETEIKLAVNGVELLSEKMYSCNDVLFMGSRGVAIIKAAK